MIPTILLLLLLPNPSISNSYTNTPLSHSSGIFYNKRGIAKISNSKLILLTHINITYLNEAKSILESYFIKSQNLCTVALKDPAEHNYASFHCDQTLKLIEDELRSIRKNHDILHDLMGDTKERKRRGLINGASNILNWLIGTPDADDAQYYSDSIKMLVNDNKQTQTLLKSQVQIISSTIKNFNSSLQSLKTVEATLNNNLRLINKYTTETNANLARLSLESVITQHATMLLSLCMRISAEYNKYIESINLGNHQIVSPSIVTPKELCEELNNYKGNFELPLRADIQNLPILYKLMSLQIISKNGLVVFALKFPLVKNTNFDAYQLIPLPIQHQNTSTFSYIMPRQPYLLLSQSKTLFSFLPDLSECHEYLEETYICANVHTSKNTDQASCEVSLLSPHVNQLPDDCETRTIRAEIETWKYIGGNQWIYILQKPITLTIVCEEEKDQMKDIVLHQTGILQLRNNCKGYTMLYLLEPSSHTNKNFTHYIPPMFVPNTGSNPEISYYTMSKKEFEYQDIQSSRKKTSDNNNMINLHHQDIISATKPIVLQDRAKVPHHCNIALYTNTSSQKLSIILCINKIKLTIR